MSAAVRPPRPRALPVIPENIPANQRAVKRWLGWRYTWSTVKQKWDKPPRTIAGSVADCTNPDNWSSFDDVMRAIENGGARFDGIGFALSTDDDLVGIDLDHCRDSETGVIEESALQIVRLINSYTEVSPSGTGLRILLRGALPPHGRKKGRVETYQDRRYLTITGQHLEGTPRSIETRAAELLAFHLEVFGPAAPPRQERTAPGPVSDADDATIVERLLRSRYAPLWSGDISGYDADDSDADLALAGYFYAQIGNDTPRVERLMRQSGLVRDKWDTPSGSWRTWLDRTLNRASNAADRYSPPRSGPVLVAANGHTDNGTAAGAPAATGGPPEMVAELEQLRAERAAMVRLLAVPNAEINAPAKIVQLTTLLAVAHKQRRLGRAADQPVPISRGEIQAASGMSKGQISEYWSRASEAGALPKTNGYERPTRTNEITGEVTELDGPPVEVAYFTLPAASLAASIDHVVRTRPAPIVRGGNRPKVTPPPVSCPEHPDADVEKRCADCQRLLAPAPEAIAESPESQVGTGEYDNHAEGGNVSPESQLGTQAETELPRQPIPIRIPYTGPLNQRYKRCWSCHVSLRKEEVLEGFCASCAIDRAIAPTVPPPDDDPARWAALGVAGGVS